ncbi:MAG: VCBS repeat-containing protein [Acidobacteriota bacterium]|nr:VCBS repeat-containing protein [Acidobacteriota bacterium]
MFPFHRESPSFRAVAFGDFDNDGRLDVFVANDTVPNFLFHNEGDGTFRELALDSGVAFNGDGNPFPPWAPTSAITTTMAAKIFS